MRYAISSGCSMKFDFDSMTPGISILPSGSFTVSNSFHSCAWRGFAASSAMAEGRASDHDPSGISGQKELRSARVAVNTTQM